MTDVSILNCGTGDTKLSFDKSNPAERIRAARIVKDMLRRGYALLIENPPASGQYTRAKDFDENTCEYVIADFDPVAAEAADAAEAAEAAEAAGAGEAEAGTAKNPPRRGGRSKRVPADSTKAVSVARVSGG